MISKTVAKSLNDQLNLELTASYIYLGMSAWCKNKEWDGFAAWFDNQAAEERAHGMKIFQYLLDQGEEVVLQNIQAETANYSSLLEVMETTLAHEQKVSKSYQDFLAEVRKEGDYATEIFLQWFVTEQVEEEATAGSIVEKLKRAGDHIDVLTSLDNLVAQTREEEGA